MTILMIHAPYHRVKNGAKSFSAVLATGIGDGYIITPTQLSILHSNPNASVVVLDKNKRRRAKGILIKLNSTTKARNGAQRYDVHIKDLKPVLYKSQKLNRNGVSVIHNGIVY